MDWIVQNLFKLPPLLEGHREEQERISDPNLNWLRDVAIRVRKSWDTAKNFGKPLLQELKAHEILSLCEAEDIAVPGGKPNLDVAQGLMQIGKVLGRIFKDGAKRKIGDICVERKTVTIRDEEQRKDRETHFYVFSVIK